MDKKDAFKNFIKNNPKLINYIKENESSIQRLYEVYDIYGEDDKVWDKYLNSDRSNIDLNNIKDIVKNIDVNSIKGHIDSAQKMIDIVKSISSKVGTDVNKIKKPLSPKTIEGLFDD